MSKKAQNGDVVKVHYTGKYRDGTIFDSSKNHNPIEFKLGEAMVIAGFEQALVGMALGEKKIVSIPQENAYGPHLPELVSNIKKTEFPPHINPELGQQLEISQPDGAPFIVTITHIHEDEVTLDANHPLAGKDLIFEIELLEINSSQPS